MKNNKLKKFELKIIFLFFFSMTFFSLSSALTIQDFLEDMDRNPEDYVIIINRSQEEVDYILKNSDFGSFVSYFDKVPLKNSFEIDKNFVLLEIPYTYLGEIYGWESDKSYVELYSEETLLPPGVNDLNYYLDHNFTKYNYLVIYPTIQEFYYSFDPNELDKSEEDFAELDLNKDYRIDEGELAFYYLNKFSNKLLNYKTDSIKTDYLVIYQNEVEEAFPGQRTYCEGFDNNSIYEYRTYNYSYFPIKSNIKQNKSIADNCTKEGTLLEVYCNNGKLDYKEVYCPFGSCNNGACKEIKKERESIFTLILKFLIGEKTITEIISEIYYWSYK